MPEKLTHLIRRGDRRRPALRLVSARRVPTCWRLFLAGRCGRLRSHQSTRIGRSLGDDLPENLLVTGGCCAIASAIGQDANFGVINSKGIINRLSNANSSHTLGLPGALRLRFIRSMHPRSPVRLARGQRIRDELTLFRFTRWLSILFREIH